MAGTRRKRPTEGAPEDKLLQEMCDNARQVAELCDVFGFEFRGQRHLIGLLEGALSSGVSFEQMSEDPELRPYIWELED